MFSVVGTLRAMTRRQACRLPPVATRSISYQSPTPFPEDLETMEDLTEVLYETAEEQEAMRAGSADIVLEDAIVDPVPAPPRNTKGFPILKGFQPHRFVPPQKFTRDSYYKMRTYTKKPLLGPDATTSRHLDLFHQLGINPLDECQNSTLMSHFVTSMGKIKKRSDTNLTWKNQRRMGKAIRRAKMMGIIPVLSKRGLLSGFRDV